MEPMCPAITRKRRPCPYRCDPGHNACHVHRDRSNDTVPDQVTACYLCQRYVTCAATQLPDRTWAWICPDHANDPRLDSAGGRLFG